MVKVFTSICYVSSVITFYIHNALNELVTLASSRLGKYFKPFTMDFYIKAVQIRCSCVFQLANCFECSTMFVAVACSEDVG